MHIEIDRQPTLTDGHFSISPLRETDIPVLAKAACDPGIWEQHPSKERGVEAHFIPYAHTLLNAGGTVVFEKIDEKRIIGCSRFYDAPNAAGDIAIGFTFIEREFWGQGVNKALKRMMIDHIFQSRDQLWLHIAPENIRSQRATEKLGARKLEAMAIDPLNTGKTSLHYCYRLSKSDWAAVNK